MAIATCQADELAASKRPSPNRLAKEIKSSRVVQLDWVRGLAILLVIDCHAIRFDSNNPLARADAFIGHRIGWMGVDLFFVLSGFLVGGLLIQEITRTGEIQTGRFLLRRMLKIWPPYYFYILFQIILQRHSLQSFVWQNVLNIQNYAGTSLSHTWSLAVEEHFYLLLPFFLIGVYRSEFLRKHLESCLIAICAVVLFIRTVTFPTAGPERLQWETHARLDSLLFGVLLSHILYVSRERFHLLLQKTKVLTLLSISVFAIALFAPLAGSAYLATFGYTVNYLGFGALMLLIYGYRGSLLNTRFYRVVAWIGRYSYGIYLWHLSVREPLAHLAGRLPASIAWFVLLAAEYSAAIVLGVLLTKLVEFPALRLRDRLFPRGAAQLAPNP